MGAPNRGRGAGGVDRHDAPLAFLNRVRSLESTFTVTSLNISQLLSPSQSRQLSHRPRSLREHPLSLSSSAVNPNTRRDVLAAATSHTSLSIYHPDAHRRRVSSPPSYSPNVVLDAHHTTIDSNGPSDSTTQPNSTPNAQLNSTMSTAPSTGQVPASSPVIDAAAFPHIIDRIIQYAPFSSLLAMRGVNNHMRARVDALLCSHLVIHTAAPDRIPGTYFYTLREPGTGQRISEPGYALPMFAFYPGACRRATSSKAVDLNEAAGAEEVGLVVPPVPEPGISVQRLGDTYRRRAEAWCLEACRSVGVLDVIGDVLDELEELAPGLSNVGAIRCTHGSRTDHIRGVPFIAPQAVVVIDYTDKEVLHPTVPALEEGLSTLTLVLKLSADLEGSTQLGRFMRTIPESLTTMNVILDGNALLEDTVVPPEGDILFDLFDVLGSVLKRVQFSAIGLSAKTAPFLGVVDPIGDPEVIIGSDTVEDMLLDHSKYVNELKRQYFRSLELDIRGRVQFGTDTGLMDWTELDIQAALDNVHLLTMEEWKAGVSDDEWDIISDLL